MLEALPVTAKLAEYQNQATELLRGHSRADPQVLNLLHHHHPRFLDKDVRWLPLPLSDADIRAAPFEPADARLTLARWYSFLDWNALTNLVQSVEAGAAGVYDFEIAAEAVITGDTETLARMLRSAPDLVSARSSRVTCFDPPVHRATLLHYIAANGVENHRQRSPKNAVEIARTLLEAGADPNALADMYGGKCTTLSMLASSSPPAEAGLQVPLIETLLDYGADPNEQGDGKWVSPIMTALVFGFKDAAATLARRGARVDRLAIAAGLGAAAEARSLLPDADPAERQRAFAVAAQLGHRDVVRMLLEAGESPNRYNPEGMHAHSTPLHQAALAGHDSVVRMLVESGARLDIPDKLWKSTPRGWAEYSGRHELAEYLRASERARAAE
jgi:ankyrin repeat protein